MWSTAIVRNQLSITIKHYETIFKISSIRLRNKSGQGIVVADTIGQKPQKAINHTFYGQPMATTHPHLIKSDELVPGVKLEEFQERRKRLINEIQKYAKDNLQKVTSTSNCHVVIIPSSTKKYMSDKIPYVFRQNSDFYYLTGCLEPDSVLILTLDEKCHAKSLLLMRPKDKHSEMWEGPRTGIDLAPNLFGVEEAYNVQNFREILKGLTQHLSSPLIWYDFKNSDLPELSNDVTNVAQMLKITRPLQSPTQVIQTMRLFKSTAEQNLMRRTCEIASDAINHVMKTTKVGHSEHHIFANIDYQCRIRNANYLAYPPVVASGINATTIHYINNTQLTRDGDLVLMDAGCEYGGYSSDITRTWPVNGEFSPAQKLLYEVVLQLQKELIDKLLKEGGNTLDDLFNTMCIRLAKYLQEIGLVPKHINNVVELTRVGYKFCPHHVSHYLGMDVHDTPLMSRSLPLMSGMVCTVEPGIYIQYDCNDVSKDFRGIGVRVEDDVLITDNKIEVLTARCLKEVIDLENLHKDKLP